MKDEILIIGISTRCEAESAIEAGYKIKTIDYFGDLDQKRLCKNISLKEEFSLEKLPPKRFFEVASNLDFDFLCYCSYFENHPDVVERFEKRCEVLGNSSKTLRAIRNWRKFFRFLRKEGIKFPETLFDIHDVPEGFLAKPLTGGGGVKVGFEALNEEFMVQKYIKGIPCSVSFLADGENSKLVSLNLQLIGDERFGARDFWWCGNVTPFKVESENVEEIERICEKLTRKFELKGSNGIDFILADDIYILEVNPRFQGTVDIVERAFGINIFELHTKAFQGELPERDFHAKKVWGKAILYSKEDVVMPDTGKWLNLKWVKDIPFPQEKILRDYPICSVLASGKKEKEVFQRLVGRGNKIRDFISSQL
ncbi:MAG: ATP-grasp domain-containing protein [Candidatus Methanofastidiosia archaeon]